MSARPPAVELILVPYDSGVRDWRMGLGPAHLAAAVESALDAAGISWHRTEIEAEGPAHGEIARTFSLWRSLSQAVAEACRRHRFPLVLSGNCGATVGAVAGLGIDGTAVAWLDAHGDFNTPDTSRSGFLDGMCAATLAGRCFRVLAAGVPGFRPLEPQRLRLFGTRDLDAGEAELLEQSGVHWLGPAEVRESAPENAGARAVNELRADRLYVHLDMDVHDPRAVPANGFQPPGGLRTEEVRKLIAAMAAAMPVAGLTIAAFDPSLDPQHRGRRAVGELVRALWPKFTSESQGKERS